MAAGMALCTSSQLPQLMQPTVKNICIGLIIHQKPFVSVTLQRNQHQCVPHAHVLSRRFIVCATTEGSAKSSKSDEQIPSWARPDSDEPPPWARDEGSGSTSQSTFQIPFYAYLLASAFIAIAAIGSIFEYANKNPVFGVLKSDSIFYAPLLGFFVFTGIPTSAFLWFKSVETANKEAEEQDRRDGYR
ncbi:uncharacterized protein LOC122014338 [Zingiber officinale]|uniref:Uncharacterized protein n=1 Tax=Zingiber officinale TaxID=94328 RepID=A0A8J5KKA7_ZINOF|nr:uncharacterized protein LOC122014338 [Zingiber officinale]XP_042426483.1 uncharacterized protein LOC122014338 [Zingiber officinale]XP_042426484.1 uncharacterized protein LOC122014338 [Zingiber officinale]KAG6482822.1 hypothetical protein ZIOFF_059461 [Zingiber officinale]